MATSTQHSMERLRSSSDQNRDKLRSVFFSRRRLDAIAEAREGAGSGRADALYLMGRCCLYGIGVRKDLRAAVRYFRRASERGNACGKAGLADCLANGWGVAKDEARAAALARESAEAGSGYGAYVFGECCWEEVGMGFDEAEAMRWYGRGARLGEPLAMDTLGIRQADGEGGLARDAKRAMRWFEAGARLGEPYATYNLAELVEGCEEVVKDTGRALMLYVSALLLGAKDAAECIGRLGREL